MTVYIEIQRRSPALREADRARLWIFDAVCRSLVDVVFVDLHDHDLVDLSVELPVRLQPVTHGNWE